MNKDDNEIRKTVQDLRSAFVPTPSYRKLDPISALCLNSGAPT